MRTIVLIPSAGKGKRLNAPLPKQFLKVNRKEILIHTLLKFQKAKRVDEIIIATNKNFIDLTEKLIDKYSISKVSKIVVGGKERQDSVYQALLNCQASDNDLICVHDAVRPFIYSDEIDEIIKFATKKKCVIAASKAIDTIKTGTEKVELTLDRNQVWLVQTPQVFTYETLKKAFEKAYSENFYGTDEASLVERLGVEIYFYQTRGENRKITNQSDLELARKFLI